MSGWRVVMSASVHVGNGREDAAHDFPERVLACSGTMWMVLGLAILPIMVSM